MCLKQAVITAPVGVWRQMDTFSSHPETGRCDCASPTEQSFFMFIALAFSSSWYIVGNQETFARIKTEKRDHHLKSLAVKFGK